MLSTTKVVRQQARLFSPPTLNLDIKPFESIPGPSNKGLPLIGHMKMLYKKPAGFAKSWLNLKEMKDNFTQNGDKLLRLNLPVLNPKNGKVVVLLDPADIEHVHRHEGKYPYRYANKT